MAKETIGLVVAGAGARGAYEAGVLSVLLPVLARQGRYPSVFAGASAGAINAVLFASLSHLDPEQAAEQVLQRWRGLSWAQVVRPLGLAAVVDVVRYLGQLVRVPGARLSALLDTAPLRRTVDGWEHWPDLHRNIDQGTVACVAVVATSFTTNRSVVFVEQDPKRRLPDRDDEHGIDYVPARLDSLYVLASSAIPVAFPAVQLDGPGGGSWYSDGGTRLNAPIKPVLAFDVDRVAIVGTHPLLAASVPSKLAPDVYDAVAQVLTAALVDQMVDDVRTLDRVNRLVREMSERGVPSSQQPDKDIPYCYVSPAEAGLIRMTADDVLAHPHQGRREPLDVDLRLLSNALGGSQSHGNLLSYLLFDPVFIERLIEMGQRDARRVTADPEALWQ